jgi:hypothetical protein
MTEPDRQQEDLKTPFSFKLMVVLVVLDLGWRLVQGVVWVWQQIT